MILIDTSGLLAALDGSERSHAAASRHSRPPSRRCSCRRSSSPSSTTWWASGSDRSAQKALVDDLAAGAYALEPFGAADIGRAQTVIEHFADLELGLADASIVVLAERHGALEVLTLDRRLRPAEDLRGRRLSRRARRHLNASHASSCRLRRAEDRLSLRARSALATARERLRRARRDSLEDPTGVDVRARDRLDHAPSVNRPSTTASATVSGEAPRRR